MREILFRGKRVNDGRWIYGSLWVKIGKPYIIPIGSVVSWEVTLKTVGQYTGLTDKNGAKIFEGDIVTAPCLGENRVVEYVANHYWAAVCVVAANEDCEYINEYSDIEVIGNIHDDNLEDFENGC